MLLDKAEDDLEYLNNGSEDTSNENDSMSRSKRIRKKKEDISRAFICMVRDCGRAYGSENSLNQHIKIKHEEFYNLMREKERLNIIAAQQ